jgi:hypothetical protein
MCSDLSLSVAVKQIRDGPTVYSQCICIFTRFDSLNLTVMAQCLSSHAVGVLILERTHRFLRPTVTALLTAWESGVAQHVHEPAPASSPRQASLYRQMPASWVLRASMQSHTGSGSRLDAHTRTCMKWRSRDRMSAVVDCKSELAAGTHFPFVHVAL